MFKNLFQYLADHTNFFKKPLWKFWYNFAVRFDGDLYDLKFMNFGYATLEGGGKTLGLEKDDEKHRYGIQLYHETMKNVPIKGKHVLEMGCGRGGGASFIMRAREPASCVGIDLSSEAIANNNTHYHIQNLAFCEGSAEKIMQEDDSIDVVLSVESSHCYPFIRQFFQEVRRVLRPGGYFCYADFRKAEEMRCWTEQLLDSGLLLLEKEDITDYVLRALELESTPRLELIKQRAPRLLRGAFKKFACVENTPNFKSLKEKRWCYFRFLLQKPEAEQERSNLFLQEREASVHPVMPTGLRSGANGCVRSSSWMSPTARPL